MEALAILSGLGQVEAIPLNQTSILKHLSDVDVLIVRLGIKVNAEVIDHAPHLKYIVTATTGTDHIDVGYAEKKKIEIICLKGENDFLRTVPSTAEHTWTLLLSLIRHLPDSFNHVREGGWDRNQFRGHNLKGMNLGIVGLGRVGSQVAGFGQAFGCQVGAFDPFRKNWIDQVEKFERLEDLLAWSTVLTIHIPYDESTSELFSKSMLSHSKRGMWIINTSRAGVWDEQAVTDMLLDSQLAGVATDVVSNENDAVRRKLNPLIEYAKNHTNIIVTPHIGGATFESMKMTEIFIAEKLRKEIERGLNVRN